MATLSNAIESMESVLEAEAKALRSGSLQHLQQIERAKRKAWANLQVARPDGRVESLSRIQSLAAHNANLLMAAKEGLSLATSLRETLAKGPKPLSTYGSNGQKLTVVIDRAREENSRSF
jgi:flagellar biosynthesis/type III secretory pathway chaperone